MIVKRYKVSLQFGEKERHDISIRQGKGEDQKMARQAKKV